ncbi:MAG: hypothetical protein CM1200mP8_6190 [Chloroflexota bacterium]|nr:MAG: hypothetical protein CM1200mP8_6190 [Chloroflexota bacterium]
MLISKLLIHFTGISSQSIGSFSLLLNSPIAFLYSFIVAVIAGLVSSLVSIISLFQAGRKINYARSGTESPSLIQKHFFDGILLLLGFIAIWYLLFTDTAFGSAKDGTSQLTSMLLPSILLVAIAPLFYPTISNGYPLSQRPIYFYFKFVMATRFLICFYIHILANNEYSAIFCS